MVARGRGARSIDLARVLLRTDHTFGSAAELRGIKPEKNEMLRPKKGTEHVVRYDETSNAMSGSVASDATVETVNANEGDLGNVADTGQVPPY